MENTTQPTTLTARQMCLVRAEKLEYQADTLYMSLLAPSMKEDALREEANHLRAQAEKIA